MFRSSEEVCAMSNMVSSLLYSAKRLRNGIMGGNSALLSGFVRIPLLYTIRKPRQAI
jgi:hypothetical protein